MPEVATAAPNMAPAFTNENPFECPAPTPQGQLARRNSQPLDNHTSIPEEDESLDTASEPAEPVTPTSETAAPFSHQHGPDEHVISETKDNQNAKPLPQPAHLTTAPEQTQPPSFNRTKSNVKMNGSSGQTPALEKPRLGHRVSSFVRGKLHRTNSPKEPPKQASHPPAVQEEKVQEEKMSVNTSVDGPNDGTTPTVNIPKYKRLGSFSLSARSTPKSSQGHSPPSPSSPSSTISDDKVEQKELITRIQSSTAIASMDRDRLGVRFVGGGTTGSKKPPRIERRRSTSTHTMPKVAPSDNTVGLINNFSKHAVEGVGLKARRLSLSLPDEFVVDSCDLDKEFKSSSLMPGKRGKCLGKGATAEVRIMARRGTNGGEELVAVKEFRAREKDEDEDEYIKKIKSEYSIAKSLRHPNIVETVRLCENRGRWNHVMEFCGHGELFSLVERGLFKPNNHYSDNDRLCFFKQLLRGVDYLHAHGIAHRDIKLENLLLDKEGHLKISDFGVAEVFSGEHPGLRQGGGECGKNMGEVRLSTPGICGSLPYIAPEVLEKKGAYDPRPLDIWSCAIVFLTMTFGGSPWQAAQLQYENYATFKKGWDEWLQTHPDGQIVEGPGGHPACGKLFSMVKTPAVKRLVLKMLHPVPEMRITIREIMDTSYVKNIDCCCPEGFEDPTCCIDTSKASSKQALKLAKTKLHLHHHIPPPPEKKFVKAFAHRFDMGDGWT